MKTVIPSEPPSGRAVSLDHGLDGSALWTLFVLSIRQHLRGRRLLFLAVLFALPVLVAILVRATGTTAGPRHLEFGLVFNLLPLALVPLAALLYASGMIRDEIEDQTLTYLLIRPLPRWALYVTKLLATYLLTTLLAGLFAGLTVMVIYWGEPGLWGDIVPVRVAQVALLFALSLAAYCAGFALISLYTQRALVIGVAYILVFEGLMANLDFAVRRLTVMYYFRALALDWLVLPRQAKEAWQMSPAELPSAGTCVLVLLGIASAATLLAASSFSRREYAVKTPEGG